MSSARTRPLVAIVGRPNVGKSTLFNRLVGEQKAVVHSTPGMTRDRHYSDAVYRMRPFTVIDTGGYEDSTDSTLLQQMRTQSIVAMEEADCVIFLGDVHEPDDPVDAEILQRLRNSGKRFFLAVNKCDRGRYAEAQAIADFSRFGLDVFPISAKEGQGVYDLLDAVTEGFEQWDPDEEEQETDILRVAIVGRQNVGKSTLLNRLLGEERVIANPLGGTTRDAIDADVEVDGQKFTVIDTAGIRRRGKIEVGPEKLSVHSSFRAIERAHVAILVLDATEGITAQDTHIAGFILERRRACIIVLNKWDAVPEREKAYSERIKEVRRAFNFMPWAPIMTVSAKTGQRTHQIWSLIKRCAENFQKHFGTAELNLILKKATSFVSPPTHKGNALTIKYVVQISTMPPTLMMFVNDPKFAHFSYRRYLSNQFYEQLGLEGTPLIIRFRRKAPPQGWDREVRQAERERPKRFITKDGVFVGGHYSDDAEGSHEVNLDDVRDFDPDEEIEQVYYIDEGDDEDDDE